MKQLRMAALSAAFMALIFSGAQLFSRLQLPYENGRYFDAGRQVVYEQQAIEGYAFIVLSAVVVLVFILVSLGGDKEKTGS